MVDVRVTSVRVQYAMTHVATNTLRLTRVQLGYLLASRDKPVRMTRVQTQLSFSDRTKPVRVTRFQVQLMQSLTQGPPDADPVPPAIPLKEREINPYRATAPLGLDRAQPELYDYLREQGEHLRQQHNLTQAGDSTFPWEQLTKVGTRKLYTPGSLGRFFHDDFGLIQARYVQFVYMADTIWINGPAGTLADSSEVSWNVTNDFNLSGTALVLGVIGAKDLPKNGEWGWLIVDGANIAELTPNTELHGDADYVVNAPLVWTKTGTIGVDKVGKPFARVRGTNKSRGLLAGNAYIHVESTPSDSAQESLAKDLALLREADDALDSRLDAIELVANPQTFEALRDQVEANKDGIAAEAEARGVDVAKLAEQIRELGQLGLDQDDLDKMAERITAAYAEADRLIGVDVTKALKDAAEALRLVKQVDLTTIQGMIDGVVGLIQQLQAKPPLIPLVVGVPPVFVYHDDGKLVLVEAYNG